MSTRVVRAPASSGGIATTSNVPIVVPPVATAQTLMTTGTHAYGAYVVLGTPPAHAAGYGLLMIAFQPSNILGADWCVQLAAGATGSEVPFGEFRPEAGESGVTYLACPYPLLSVAASVQLNARASDNAAGSKLAVALTLLPL